MKILCVLLPHFPVRCEILRNPGIENHPVIISYGTGAKKLILDLPRLWAGANQEEKRSLLLSMLDAIYVDAKKLKSIIAVKPKPPFRPIFQVAVTRAGSKIHIINEPFEGSAVFLVEAGESRTPRPREATQNILQA